MAAESGRRCHYEVLGLRQDCTADEIRSAYRKLALQLHPDKLVQSGLSQAEATAKFQELAQAYEVLSDPKERAWYDSHRSQILFADRSSGNSDIPNLFSFFSSTVYSGYSDSKKGFYRVYSDVFNKIYANEVNFARKLGLGIDAVREAPAMGNLESPYAQVTAFYGYWLGFSTVMDFCWVDQYDAMAGVNRKSRRVMEEENKKLRKKARREYNETVRGLAEFAKKRDKRVIDMAVKRNLEMEKKKEEERERKKRMERERLERVMAYEEPEWARATEGDEEEENWVEEVDEDKNGKELYCVVCKKKFKSEKQWKNHEQSKKHREKVAEFRESIGDEEFEEDGLEGEGEAVNDGVEELGEKIRDGVRIGEEEEVELSNGDEDEFVEVGTANEIDEDNETAGLDAEDDDNENGENDDNGERDNVDDEIGVLEAMLGRRRNRKKHGSLREETNETSINIRVESDDDEFMDYNKRNATRRSRRARKERSGKNGEEAVKDERNGASAGEQNKESNGDENLQHPDESSSRSVAENESNGKEDDLLADNKKSSNQRVDKKGNNVKNAKNAKAKNSSKGKKTKAASKNSSNTCDKCGEEFESKNKLHKHLTDSGHATLKYR